MLCRGPVGTGHPFPSVADTVLAFGDGGADDDFPEDDEDEESGNDVTRGTMVMNGMRCGLQMGKERDRKCAKCVLFSPVVVSKIPGFKLCKETNRLVDLYRSGVDEGLRRKGRPLPHVTVKYVYVSVLREAAGVGQVMDTLHPHFTGGSGKRCLPRTYLETCILQAGKRVSTGSGLGKQEASLASLSFAS